MLDGYSMLRAYPSSIFSWNFSIVEGGTEVAELKTAWMSERGTLTIRGTEYDVYRQGWLHGAFVIAANGTFLAQAEKPSPFLRQFNVDCGHHQLRLTARSPFTRAFGIYNGDSEIGSIYPDHCFTRKATINLPNKIILPVQGFLFWLVLLMWRRSANNSSNS